MFFWDFPAFPSGWLHRPCWATEPNLFLGQYTFQGHPIQDWKTQTSACIPPPGLSLLRTCLVPLAVPTFPFPCAHHCSCWPSYCPTYLWSIFLSQTFVLPAPATQILPPLHHEVPSRGKVMDTWALPTPQSTPSSFVEHLFEFRCSHPSPLEPLCPGAGAWHCVWMPIWHLGGCLVLESL